MSANHRGLMREGRPTILSSRCRLDQWRWSWRLYGLLCDSLMAKITKRASDVESTLSVFFYPFALSF
jgi:hypothetical protein